MGINKIKVTIKGIGGILMHAFPQTEIKGIDKMTPEEQAAISAYKDENGELFIPGIAIQRALVAGAAFSKGKGRSTLQKQVCACVMVSPERVMLGTKKYVIDSRPVVVPATKGRIMRHRPKLENWSVTFDLEYDTTLLSEKEIRQVVDDTGSRIGLLDFRPEKKGPFGRFQVNLWECF